MEDKVWLEAQHLNTSHPSNKLALKHYRPFLVKEIISHMSFQLQLPPFWRIHPVKGFTPLCLTWAIQQLVMDWCCNSLASTRGIREQGRTRGSDWVGMNLIVIEEHQAGDLVLAQAYYLYILLEATLACVIIPIAKVPQTKYSNY